MSGTADTRPTVVVALQSLAPEEGGRGDAPWGPGYRPHLVVDRERERELREADYLGVEFEGEVRLIHPGAEHLVTLRLLFHPDIDYSALATDARFTVREGLRRIVARGRVVEGVQAIVAADMRPLLENLARALDAAGDAYSHRLVRNVLDARHDRIDEVLKSNELWGGSGSIADHGGIDASREARRAVERALIELGERQISCGIVSVRTEMWVSAFRSGRDSGV